MGLTEVPAQDRVIRNLRIAGRVLGVVVWFGSGSGIAYGTLMYSGFIIVLVCIPIAITFAISMQVEPHDHKPQKYWLPHVSLWNFLVIGSILSAAGYFSNPKEKRIFIILYVLGMVILLVFGGVAIRLAKSMGKTGEIDAIAWLLRSTHDQNLELFKKAGRIARSENGDYKPRLLESLMPLLSSLITSYATEMLDDGLQPENLETYVSCLALLSAFPEYTGSCVHVRLREDVKRHPRLEPEFRKKLRLLAKDP